MSDATPVSTQLPAAVNAAAGVVAHSTVDNAPLHRPTDNGAATINPDKPKKAEDADSTNLSYSVDRASGQLRLKVSNSKGETIRELTFTDFVSTMKPTSVGKGVLVDDRS